MFLRESVRKCLFAPGVSLLALAFAACSQQTEPEEWVQPASPVVVSEPTPDKKPARVKKKKEKVVLKEKTPVAASAVPAEEPAAAPAPEATPAPAPATFSPVEMTTPFVPSAPGKRIAHVNVPGPYVAVTFDDGPSAALTPQVLDIFNRHGARATFFVQGQNANRHRSLLARAAAEGHEIGSHTWSHINMRASSRDKIIRELDRTADVIAEATGSRPRVMRPPYGSVNRELVNFVYNRYGTPAILWDVDTNDWRKPGVQTVVNRAVGKAKPGSIILLHDIHPSTIAAVEDIVTGLQARGFRLVTVSELIAMGRRAAGAAAPEREAEPVPAVETPPAAPAAESEAVMSAPLHAQQQQQPQGGASIGMPAPAPEELPAAAPAPPASPTPDADFNFYEA